jgi:hypothetical protein
MPPGSRWQALEGKKTYGMKWIGLAFLIVSALLSMDHRNWFVPAVMGVKTGWEAAMRFMSDEPAIFPLAFFARVGYPSRVGCVWWFPHFHVLAFLQGT